MVRAPTSSGDYQAREIYTASLRERAFLRAKTNVLTSVAITLWKHRENICYFLKNILRNVTPPFRRTVKSAIHTVDAHTAEVSVLDFSHLFSVKCDEWRKNSSGCGRRSMLKICLNIFSSFFAIIISSDLLSIILFFCRWTAYHLTHTVSSFLQQDLQIR